MQQQRACIGAGTRDGRRSLGIDAERGFRLVFGAVHRGICGRVDHHIGQYRANQFLQRCRRIEIGGHVRARTVARSDDQITQRRKAAPQFAAHLPIAAEQQQLHALNRGSRSAAISASNGATASLAESEASASGQSMASCGSSQRSELSLSRS